MAKDSQKQGRGSDHKGPNLDKPPNSKPGDPVADERTAGARQGEKRRAPPVDHGVATGGPVPSLRHGQVTARVPSAVMGNQGVIPPRAKGSGFPKGDHSQEQVDEYQRTYLPNQALEDPKAHPDTPAAIVNQPYGSEPQSLDPETGTVRYQRPDPETIKDAGEREAA